MLIPDLPTRPIVSFLLALIAAGTAHASDVNARISIGGELSPGVYGSIDIGNRPPPPVVYPQPVVIVQQQTVVQHAPPLYLHVPPGHAKKWGKHCHKYRACDRPVYFVRSAEYDDDRGRGRGREGHRGHRD